MPKEPMAPISRPLFIVGEAQHGKSTVRTRASELLGLKGGSCSDTIFSVWSLLSGFSEAHLRSKPKQEIRPVLVALGDWLTAVDGPASSYRAHFPFRFMPRADPSVLEHEGMPLPHPGFLIQFAYQNGVRVLDGVRRPQELEAIAAPMKWFGIEPFILWVENPYAPKVEGDNFAIPRFWAHDTIVNDGSIHDLHQKTEKFVNFFKSQSCV